MKRSSWPDKPANFPVGVVGLGLMGTSVATCLLAAGHPLAAVEIDDNKRRSARRRILNYLRQMKKEGLLRSDPNEVIGRLTVSNGYASLETSHLVVECVFENLSVKKDVLRKLEGAVSPKSIIGTNTSGLPVTVLQEGAQHPERIVGIHWGEPAHITRFMEIICGKHTNRKYADDAAALSHRWGKEPSIVRRDIRGFITNRCMYALLREAFYLVEAGYATVADVDRSLRNDLGYWITLAGPFRFMDLTGIPAYAAVMKDLFPELNCAQKVPALMRKVVKSGARGVSNAKGFYSYTPQEAARWEKQFMKFSYEIRALAQRYPEVTVKQERAKK
ncbi:MAG TPA: 3-hydroxyacyl-CoA dehydrogenase family protein [Terriglobia bacterium]|nr:3-hydroxyacyl-CoA dehydrogenase family protein [Terriglobia bacterium]